MKFGQVAQDEKWYTYLQVGTMNKTFTPLNEHTIDALNNFSNYNTLCEFSQLRSDRRAILMR
jgi:hypothetical protein